MYIVYEHILITIKTILFILNKTIKLDFMQILGTANIPLFIQIKTKTIIGLIPIIQTWAFLHEINVYSRITTKI